MPRPTIEEALNAHTPELMAIPDVVGTGLGEDAGRPCILVLVRQKSRDIERRIPKLLDGFPTKVTAVGEVRPLERP